jgi:hypothetical protein
VLRAQSQVPPHHRTEEFRATLRRVTESLRQLHGTAGEVFLLAASGTGATGNCLATSGSLGFGGGWPGFDGNADALVLTIAGKYLAQGATAALTRAGESDIAGTSVSVAPDGLSLSARFDLVGRLAEQTQAICPGPLVHSAGRDVAAAGRCDGGDCGESLFRSPNPADHIHPGRQ